MSWKGTRVVHTVRRAWKPELHRHEIVQQLEGEIELEIDIDQIFRELGSKALLSKRGKSVAMSGLLIARRK